MKKESKRKELAEMTLKEFLDQVEDKDVAEEVKAFLDTLLRSDGFSDDQINEMKMEKLWKLMLHSFSALMDNWLTLISVGLEKKPERKPLVLPILKKLTEHFRKMEKELKEQIEEKKKKE